MHQSKNGSDETRKSFDFDPVAPLVVEEIHDEGIYIKWNDKSTGPFAWKDVDRPEFDVDIAAQLGCQAKDVLKARLLGDRRPLSASDLCDIMGTTIIEDKPVKLIVFLGYLLAQLDEDKYNVGLQAESSAGKSYIVLEVVEYFPEQEKRIYAGASPTNFYHEAGVWCKLKDVATKMNLKGLFDQAELNNEKQYVILVDLENKILIFLDQPHWMLAQRLRPLLSHDSKILRYGITDRREKYGLRSKIVLIRGYPTVAFATAQSTQEDQERTRMWLLSPGAGQEKLKESLKLLAEKISNREKFKEWVDAHPKRRWLRDRVMAIRDERIRNVVIPKSKWEELLSDYMKKRPKLSPRTQRDWPRLLYLVKGFALLNCFHRKKIDDHTIEADDSDVKEAVSLYEEVANANELGVSPETLKFYQEVILPLAANGDGVSRKDIACKFHELYGRPISQKRLKEDVLPSLESAGLVTSERNPKDMRETLIHPTVTGYIVTGSNNMPDNSGVLKPSGPTLPDYEGKTTPVAYTQEVHSQVVDYLNEITGPDRIVPREKFTEKLKSWGLDPDAIIRQFVANGWLFDPSDGTLRRVR